MNAATLPLPPSLDRLLQAGEVALFLDFDGTLVAIAGEPDGIAVPDRLAAGLTVLGQRLGGRLALVSGRSLDNLDTHLGPIAIARAGSHGADRRRADGSQLGEPPLPIDDDTMQALDRLARHHDALLERKAHGAAIHYRAVPDAAPAIRQEAEMLAAHAGLAMKHGKCVVELVRPGASKAGAVGAFMEHTPFAGAMPIFIGDDLTDEDGFAAANRQGGFGIAVGTRPSQHARYRLDTVAQVHEWLSL
ncbi:MAG: trehalose-phosphatase [Pontixanthobacter sp.]